jgi:hypothetical protein
MNYSSAILWQFENSADAGFQNFVTGKEYNSNLRCYPY